MDESYYYLLVNIACLSIPFIFSFHPRLKFHLRWDAFLAGVTMMMAIFIPWDIFFTSQGVWGFNTKYTTGIFMFNLPIEEWLFFFCIPYASIFTYHCMRIFTDENKLSSGFRFLAWFFAVASLIIAFSNISKWYTFTSHLLCSLLLFYHLIFLRKAYLKTFMMTFLILLIPFIGSNGILTGITFWEYPFINIDAASIAEKIVWYNPNHNLPYRIFTMPVDDLSYGLTMLLFTVTIFEWVIAQKITVQE